MIFFSYMIILNLILLILVNISYSNYRNSPQDGKDEESVDSDDSNRDFDRFVVRIMIFMSFAIHTIPSVFK